MQRDLAVLARARSIRIVGPNCLGVMSNHPDIRLNATFTGIVPPAGGLAVATQSGGVGIVLTDLARELGLGVGSLVSLGNKADVSGNDLLAAWTDDPHVSAAALYLESFGNAPKFARIARRFAEAKPLLAVVGGRSAGGHRAGASHTAASATPAVGVDALFAQAGVIACEDAEDLAQAALLLTREPMPRRSAGRHHQQRRRHGRACRGRGNDPRPACARALRFHAEGGRRLHHRHSGHVQPRGRRSRRGGRRLRTRRRAGHRERGGRRSSRCPGCDQPHGPRPGAGGARAAAREVP